MDTPATLTKPDNPETSPDKGCVHQKAKIKYSYSLLLNFDMTYYYLFRSSKAVATRRSNFPAVNNHLTSTLTSALTSI